MLASDRTLASLIHRDRLSVQPTEDELLQPASIDMRLDRFFQVFATHRYSYIDPSKEQPGLTESVEIEDGKPFILHPGQFALGSTMETVTLDDTLAARLEGKSSLGRLGLLVHSTAGFIDPGFTGTVTLELSNAAGLPIHLWPGMKIGQLCVFALTESSNSPYGSAAYGSHYQNQPRGPQASQGWRNFRTWPTRQEEILHA